MSTGGKMAGRGHEYCGRQRAVQVAQSSGQHPLVSPLRRGTLVAKSRQLQDELLLLGSVLERAIAESLEALQERNLEKSWSLLADIGEVKGMRSAIEAGVLTLIATQHPVAGDLRVLAALLEISSELGQMSRHLEEINKLSLMPETPLPTSPVEIGFMAREVAEMLHLALGAFTRRNLEEARAVAAADDRVDQLYERANQALCDGSQGPQAWGGRLYMLRVAHHLERIGDRAVNICEWVHYVVTAELLELA